MAKSRIESKIKIRARIKILKNVKVGVMVLQLLVKTSYILLVRLL